MVGIAAAKAGGAAASAEAAEGGVEKKCLLFLLSVTLAAGELPRAVTLVAARVSDAFVGLERLGLHVQVSSGLTGGSYGDNVGVQAPSLLSRRPRRTPALQATPSVFAFGVGGLMMTDGRFAPAGERVAARRLAEDVVGLDTRDIVLSVVGSSLFLCCCRDCCASVVLPESLMAGGNGSS